MEIKSFGSSIESGKYLIHSRFQKVFNYTSDNKLISVVTPDIGTGPNNIVLSNLPENRAEAITITDDYLLFNDFSLAIPRKSKMENYGNLRKTFPNFLSNLEIVLSYLSEKSPEKSLTYLLFPDQEKSCDNSFDNSMVEFIKETTKKLSLSRLEVIAKSLKGVGYGLTPSGDDFNCGLLYALNYLNIVLDEDFGPIIEACYQNSLGNNLISNTFLKYAYLNQPYQKFAELLLALRENYSYNILISLDKVLAAGHTSGSDMLTGFILVLKGVINDQKYC